MVERLISPLSLLCARTENRESSSLLFWDMPPPGKVLPMLPANEAPAPPLPLAERRPYNIEMKACPTQTPAKRISWSEQQINNLQKDVKELRQQIINQRRKASENEQELGALRRENSLYKREIDRQRDIITLANSVIVAVTDFQTKSQTARSSTYSESPILGGRQRSNRGHLGNVMSEISDIIQIYNRV